MRPAADPQPSTVIRTPTGAYQRVHAWPARGWTPGPRLRAIRAAEGLIAELAGLDWHTATRAQLRELVKLAGELHADLARTERET